MMLSAPVIQNMEFIVHRDVGGKQLGNCAHNARRLKIGRGFIIATDHEDAGVMPFRLDDQFMQVEIIIVVSREEYSSFANGMLEMNRIWAAREVQGGGDLHVVLRLAQQPK